MDVLTVQNPYAVLIAARIKRVVLIAARIKRVENRGWKPAPGRKGALYIHAGKEVPKLDALRETVDWLRSDCGIKVDVNKLQTLCIASAGRIVCKGIVGDIHITQKTLPNDQKPFFFEPYGWELGGIQPWLSVQVRGHLGIWHPTLDFKSLTVDAKTERAWVANVEALVLR